MKRALLLFALFLAPNIVGAEMDLDAVIFQYEDYLGKIHGSRLEAEKAVGAQYTAALKNLQAKAQGDGDLDLLKLVLAETKRFEGEGSPPAAASGHSELQKLADTLAKRLREFAIKEAGDIVKVSDRYDATLETLQKSLTREGKLEKATAVQRERKLLESSDRLAAARSLASADSAVPSRQPAGTPPMQAAPGAWRSLSNGRSFAGWDPEGKAWRVENEAFVCSERSKLRSAMKYQNFELELEWRMSPRANGGIFYAYNKTGPELQLSDPAVAGGTQTGGLYGVLKPDADAAKPTGT